MNLKALRKLLATSRTFKNFALGKLIVGRRLKDALISTEGISKWLEWLKNWKGGSFFDVAGALKEFHDYNNKINSDESAELKVAKPQETAVLTSGMMKSLYGNDAVVDNRSFPSYLSGSAYVLSEEAAKKLYAISSQIPSFVFEDIYFTGILAQKTKTNVIDSDFFKILHGESFDVCSSQVSSHYVTTTRMYELWKEYTASKCF